MYGARGKNFMHTMLRLGQSKPALKVIDDQIGAPTPARLIAEVTLMALRGGVSKHGKREGNPALRPIASGVYHLAPRGETIWHGFATAIFELATSRGVELTRIPSDAARIRTSEYPAPAKRPLNPRLSLTKLEFALGVERPHWQDQVQTRVGRIGRPNVKLQRPATLCPTFLVTA